MNSVRAHVICLLIFYLTIGALGTGKDWIKNVTEKKKPILDLTQRALNHGYLATEHTVETEDGYILTVFRIQRPSGVKGHPVLLMHGLLLSASMWIDGGPGVALAYLLADTGHDVWLGNVRGTYYSRRHAWLNPDFDSQYWQFCVDEIGRYDHPAVIDYILSQTEAPKLDYIGFSQGGGTFFIMCSERPEYHDKVNVMIALAPATRHLLTKSLIFYSVTNYFAENEEELNNLGVWEALPKGGLFQSLLKTFCALSEDATKVCETIIGILDGLNPGSITKTSFRAITASTPAGTSVHNMARFGQSFKTKEFKKFDYGPDRNLVRYGSKSPPVHDLSAVTVPTVVIYGRNDGIVDIRDVKWLLGKLPNVIEAYEVKDHLWSHLDFGVSKNIPHLLYPKIEQYLSKNS